MNVRGIIALMMGIAVAASAAQVTVTWTFASTNLDGAPITDLAGAKVYYGTTRSNYTHVINLPGGQPGQKCSFSVTGLVAGIEYYLTGTAYNTAGSESVFCEEVAKTATNLYANLSPVVNAGSDGTAQNQVKCLLRGDVTDDGLPEGASLTVTWSKVDGPGVVTFVDSNAVATVAFFEHPGRYTLRLTATDGEKTASDEIIYDVVYQAPKKLRVTE